MDDISDFKALVLYNNNNSKNLTMLELTVYNITMVPLNAGYRLEPSFG